MDARLRDIDALRGEVGDKDGALEELRQQRAVEQATEQVGAAVLAMRGSADEETSLASSRRRRRSVLDALRDCLRRR